VIFICHHLLHPVSPYLSYRADVFCCYLLRSYYVTVRSINLRRQRLETTSSSCVLNEPSLITTDISHSMVNYLGKPPSTITPKLLTNAAPYCASSASGSDRFTFTPQVSYCTIPLQSPVPLKPHPWHNNRLLTAIRNIHKILTGHQK